MFVVICFLKVLSLDSCTLIGSKMFDTSLSPGLIILPKSIEVESDLSRLRYIGKNTDITVNLFMPTLHNIFLSFSIYVS